MLPSGYRTPKDEFGKKIGKSYLHEELAVFATPSREIKFCFDYETKPETKLHIERDISVTGRLLQKSGAKVKVISLPGPDKGVDDLLVAQGPLTFELLNHQAKHLKDWQRQNQKQRAATISPPRKLTVSVVESTLTALLPLLIEQLSQDQQQLSAVKPTFEQLCTVIERSSQRFSSQRTIDVIAENIEQSVVESALNETLPQLIEQLSEYRQQLSRGKPTFEQFEQLLDNEIVGDLNQKTRASEHLAINAISDYVDEEAVTSHEQVSALDKLHCLLGRSPSQTHTEFTTALQKVLDLIEKLAHHQNHSQFREQPLSSKLTTDVEGETKLLKESVNLQLKQMIHGLARDKLADLVMEVGKYIKGEKVTGEKVSELFASVTPVTLTLTF
jgi:Domain of unknown function (DUF3854)